MLTPEEWAEWRPEVVSLALIGLPRTHLTWENSKIHGRSSPQRKEGMMLLPTRFNG